MKKLTSLMLLVAMFVSILVLPSVASAQVRAKYDMGAIGLGQKLKRLQTVASAMHTGAHPDDEDSGLMAYLARNQHSRTVYLALNRGDGGQNVIGDELFEPLGVIRSEELLQARRLDGGQQMFTRVMDYGFSKKREEAARIWGEELTLKDMVRAIRLFRPLVIISRFSGTPADGHGQHQLAGYLTPIAFKAAADPKMFPEHFREGLRPWKALKLYRGVGFRPDPNSPPSMSMNTGTYDQLIGRSYFEIAMEGRSQHKTQEMGTLELRGEFMSGEILLESNVEKQANETSVFDGIDTSITAIAGLTNNAEEPFKQKLAELEQTAKEALAGYDPYNPQKLVPVLLKGYKQALDAEWSTRNPDSKEMLRGKQQEFVDAILLANGIVVDALSETDKLVPGNSTGVAVRVFASNESGLKVKKIALNVPDGWQTESAEEPKVQENAFRPRTEKSFESGFFKISAPENAKLTAPYWLEKPRNANFTFDWSSAGNSQNMPFQAPLVTATATLEIDGQEFPVSKEVQYRYADDIRGEIRRDLNIVPAVNVGLDSNLLIAPTNATPSKYKVVMTVQNNMPSSVDGTATIDVPKGWSLSPANAEFKLPQTGDKTALGFEVTIPANAKPDSYPLTANAMVGGKKYDQKVLEIAYPHIQTHRIYSRADVTAQVLNLKVAPVRIGYIMGSGDQVPDAIKRLGLDVSFLDEKELSTGNLNAYDTIVVGIRASQVRPDYVANNLRLTEFVRNGGNLIVQYQQQEFARNKMTPFPANMVGNARTVDETAPVRILVPSHPLFNLPNKISAADFDNWVQERNLYSLTEWDARFTPLLETHDEGEAEIKGGMLHAKIGKGNYYYTSFSWFRQLPKGVPGAYRIFANMLSTPRAK